MVAYLMEAIVLAGGLGTRLRKVVPDLPKPLAPIAGRPFLQILLTSLSRKRFTRVVLSVGFKAEKIRSYFGDRFGNLELVYVFEPERLGTGGAVRLAMQACTADHVFILNGDTFLDFDADQVERHWQAHRRPIIVGREQSDTARYGRLLTAEGAVIGIAEKGVTGPGLINAGCYILNRGQLDRYPAGAAFSLETDYLPAAVTSTRFDLYVTTGRFIDIGIPEDYERAQNELAGC
jgi:D-glycero-alpha-D-manno-heptose 1-phosphate guanylyltransferase